MEAVNTAQVKMNSIIAKRKLLEVLTKNTSLAADQNYKLWAEVLVSS